MDVKGYVGMGHSKAELLPCLILHWLPVFFLYTVAKHNSRVVESERFLDPDVICYKDYFISRFLLLKDVVLLGKSDTLGKERLFANI